METLSTPQKELCPAPPSGVVSDSLSLSSYKEYPTHRPLINTYHTPQTHTHLTSRLSSPSKAFPETNSTAILSALRNLQEKIRRLELEEGRGRLNLYTTGTGDTSQNLHRTGGDTSHTPRQSEKVTRRLSDLTQRDTGRETTYHSNCNQALITQLAAAESRCVQLERQLEHMRRMVRHAKSDRTSLLKQQVSARSAEPVLDAVSEQVQMEKLERLEQEYLRLTRTQSIAERKICEIEIKLQEEEHQRKLVQDKAKQLQTGLEANRILLQSVSPRLPRSRKRSKEKRPVSKKSLQQSSHTQPHYRLSLGDVPFVTGTSVGGSHSVRANVQSVLSLLKQHQPQLCNSRVLSHKRTDSHSQSDSSSSSSSGGSGEELSELLHGLQEELRLMSIEQDELMRQGEASVSERERKELQRDQEMLLLKMERKGEQINKLYRHKTQMKKLRREASGSQRRGERSEVRVTTTVATRGRSAGTVKVVAPGERSKKNLRLLRDMRALQSSLRT